MVSDLKQVERHERAIGVLAHAEGSARVQDEQSWTIRSDPTENLDLAHRTVAVSVERPVAADRLSLMSRHPISIVMQTPFASSRDHRIRAGALRATRHRPALP
jgi:hypothetical protein